MKIKEIFKNFIIILLVIILVNICYSAIIKKDNPIKLFGKSFLIVTTESMKPTINAGELIIISEKKNYEINDIVTYFDEDDFCVTHRIIEKNNSKIITRGDSNNINDEEIDLSRVKGKVIFHSKILGFFILYLLKPLIFAYIISLIIINFVSCYFKKNEGREKENKETNNNS